MFNQSCCFLPSLVIFQSTVSGASFITVVVPVVVVTVFVFFAAVDVVIVPLQVVIICHRLDA